MLARQLYFITGIGRSGTTLLGQVLNNHPYIHTLPEANFIVFFLHSLGHKKNISAKDIDEVFEQIDLYALTHPWIGWEFDSAKVKQLIVAKVKSQDSVSFNELCTEIYAQFKVRGMDKDQASILLTKNPATTLFLEQIFEVFPDSKFILLVRDYRGNVLSRKQNVYLKTPNVLFNAFRWRWMTERALSFAEAHPARVLVVRYEDLTASPEDELKKICVFLGVPERSDLLENFDQFAEWKSRKEDVPDLKRYADKKFSDLSGPINQTRALAWQKQLSRKEIIACDVICSKTGAKFGYEPFYQVSDLKKVWLKVKLFGYSVFTSLYMNKEVLVNYLSPRLKLWRLRQIYKKHGFGSNKE